MASPGAGLTSEIDVDPVSLRAISQAGHEMGRVAQR